MFSVHAGIHIGSGPASLPLPVAEEDVGGVVWDNQRAVETEGGESMSGQRNNSSYSRTYEKGLSEIGTTSLQRTLVSTPC